MIKATENRTIYFRAILGPAFSTASKKLLTWLTASPSSTVFISTLPTIQKLWTRQFWKLSTTWSIKLILFILVKYFLIKVFIYFEDEKKANKYEYDWNDDDDDFILISLDGIYKQIYIGRDMPIEYGKSRLSVQPIISEIVEDFQYYLE